MAAKYAEQSGHGIPTIVEKYGKDVFSFDDGMLKVTLPLAFERPEVTVRKRRILHKTRLTENQKLVIDILSEDGTLTLKSVSEKTGISLVGVKKICSKLQKYGVLERIGAKCNGKWIVK